MSLKLSNNDLKKEYLSMSLNQGDIVPIIIEKNDGSYYLECNAVLIERLDSWHSSVPFPFIEYSETRVVNAIKEKWKVMVRSDSPFDNGRKLVRWVYRYHSEGIVSVSEEEDNTDFDDDGDENLPI